jgi:chromosome segregation ATPase
MCVTGACKNMSISMNVLEAEILKTLEQLTKDMESKSKEQIDGAVNISVLQKMLRKIEIEEDGLNKQLDKTHDLLEQGIYETSTFLARTKSISDKGIELKQRKNEIQQQIIVINKQQYEKKKVIPTISNIVNTYNSIEDIGKKNDLLKTILVKVTYLKTQRSTKKNPLGNAEITLFPRI